MERGEDRNPDFRIASELKMTSQMRTGKRSEQRGMMGVRVGSGSSSYARASIRLFEGLRIVKTEVNQNSHKYICSLLP